MQAWRGQGHDLIPGRFVDQPLLEQAAVSRHQGAELLQVFHRGGDLDLCKRSLAVIAFDESGHFGGPDALTGHGAEDSPEVAWTLFSHTTPDNSARLATKMIVKLCEMSPSRCALI